MEFASCHLIGLLHIVRVEILRQTQPLEAEHQRACLQRRGTHQQQQLGNLALAIGTTVATEHRPTTRCTAVTSRPKLYFKHYS